MLEGSDAAACDLAALATDPDSRSESDLVVALGGDGTILKAVHLEDGGRTPILGVNLGRLGFMSGADAVAVEEAVTTALEGGATIESRATLHASVETDDGDVTGYRGLNEVYVGRNAPHRVVSVAVSVNGTRLSEFYCDGVIVATPTGSTAYALSFGGPIVSPAVSALVLVAAGAHTLLQRPMVLAGDDTIELAFPEPARADACVSIDGGIVPCGGRLVRVSVTTDPRPVLLAKVDGNDFYEVVRRKLLGG
jgi:NAD+ kinase